MFLLFDPVRQTPSIDLEMSMQLPDRSDASDTIAKLISAGYLDPDHRNDPAAITNAIARMKMDLRGRTGSELPRPPQ